jgi:hypothetical protein
MERENAFPHACVHEAVACATSARGLELVEHGVRRGLDDPAKWFLAFGYAEEVITVRDLRTPRRSDRRQRGRRR